MPPHRRADKPGESLWASWPEKGWSGVVRVGGWMGVKKRWNVEVWKSERK